MISVPVRLRLMECAEREATGCAQKSRDIAWYKTGATGIVRAYPLVGCTSSN